jgi:hypothetical protein
MSRILRRPLFRGGPVSSYGTGIASGLADGGRVGFYRGGGTKNKTTVLSQPKTLMPWDLGATQSGNKGAFGYLQGVSGPMWTGADIMNFIQDNPKWGGTNFSGILQGKWNSDTNRYEPPAVAHKYAMEQINDPELLKVMRNMMDPDLPLMDPNKTPEENTTVDTEEIWDDYDAGNEAKGIEVNKGEQTVDNNTGKVIDPEESTAISADDVREQAALFDKLLNEDYKKDLKSARISDASDYALKFFEETIGKGKGMKEAAGEVAGFALAKPSKTETVKEGKKKTKQTATVMAINDALAQGKSERSIDMLIAKSGLDLDNKKKLVDYTQSLTKGFQALSTHIADSKAISWAGRVKDGLLKSGLAGYPTVQVTSVDMKDENKFKFDPAEDVGKVFIETDTETAYIFDKDGNRKYVG